MLDPTVDPELPREKLQPAAPPAPISRRLVLVLGAVVLTAAVVGTAVATGVMNLRGLSGEPGGGSAAPSPSPAESVPESRLASPSAAPSVAPPPSGGIWAEVVAESVPVHAAPALDAPVVGTLTVGQLVYVHPNLPISADGLDWYEVQATPSIRGWVTEADEEVLRLRLMGASGTVEWCAAPTERAYPEIAYPLYEPNAVMELGHVPIPSSLFSPVALGTADLAWADGGQTVCAVLEIQDGEAVSATFHADIDTCGKPFGNAYGWALRYGSRWVEVADAVLGYAQMDPGWRNADLIVYLTGAGAGSANNLVSCIRVTANGDSRDGEIATTVRADVCATLVSLNADRVVLRGIAPWGFGDRDVEFLLHPGSEIDPAIQAGVTLGMRIESDRGTDGALRISPVAVSGCEATPS